MTQTEIENVTNEILKALIPAPEERKVAALKALRGEAPEPAARPVTGPLLLGMGQAARFLGVSRSTLWRILQAKTIQQVELFPGSFRVRREDLMALAAGEMGFSGKVSRRGRPRKIRGQLAGGSGQKRAGTDRTDDPRFRALKALADEGDENAAADLFKEFAYDYEAGRFVGPPSTPAPAGEVRRGGSADAESDGAA